MLYDNDTFEHRGRTFRVEFPFDDSHAAPWKECDGHGEVSEWTTRDKSPGERVLHSDRQSKRFYDVQSTTAIARRDGWGLGDDDKAKLAQRLGREPTRGDIVVAAVDRDFEYLRGWCNDEWHYCGVVVRLDEDVSESESLWGIENNDYAYCESVARDLADEICDRLDDEMAQAITEARPDMQPAKEGKTA